MLFLAHTCLLVDERERERDSLIHSKRVVCGFSLSLSRARAKKKKTKRRTEEAPVAHLPTDASSSSSSFYRPTDRKERRKKENAQKEYQKGLHRIVSSLFFPPSTKKKTTRVIYSPRTSLFFSRTPEKTKKTKTCRSLSLFLSVSQSTFVKSVVLLNPLSSTEKVFVVDRRKKRRKREIFFSKKKTYKTLNETASFFCC